MHLEYLITKEISSPQIVSTGMASLFGFNIFTSRSDLTYVNIDFGDETSVSKNITGK